jgi:hypothetical protein
VFTRHTTAADTAEAFGVVEFRLPVPEGMRADQTPQRTVDGRAFLRDFAARLSRAAQPSSK